MWRASPETKEPAEELSGGAASAQEPISFRVLRPLLLTLKGTQ